VAGIAASLSLGGWLAVLGHPRWGAAAGGAGFLFFSRLIPRLMKTIFTARDNKINNFLDISITEPNIPNGYFLFSNRSSSSDDLIIPLSFEQRSFLCKLAQSSNNQRELLKSFSYRNYNNSSQNHHTIGFIPQIDQVIRLWHCFFNQTISLNSYEILTFCKENKTNKLKKIGEHLWLNNQIRKLKKYHFDYSEEHSSLIPFEIIDAIFKQMPEYSLDALRIWLYLENNPDHRMYSLISGNDLSVLLADIPLKYNPETQNFVVGADPTNSCIIDGEAAHYIREISLWC